MKGPVIPADDEGKRQWLINFAAKLSSYATLVGVNMTELSEVQAWAVFWTYVLDTKNAYEQFSQNWTAFKNHVRSGTGPLVMLPVAPVVAPPPPLSSPDIFGQLGRLVTRIKNHPGCTEAMAQDLDIVGAEQTFDPSTMKPILKLTLQAGRPNVGWKKQGMGSLEIWVDRGQGFILLAIDTIPDYLDTAPLPAAGVSALWKYKAIYRLNDEQVGQWSDVASISVIGA